MKKSTPLIILIALTGFGTLITAREKNSLVYDTSTTRDSLKGRITQLTETHQYDSAQRLCMAGRTSGDLHFDDLETGLANIYLAKGDKTTAYQYVLNNTNYLIANAAPNFFPRMLYDYDYAYTLCTDSFLEKMVVDKVSDAYS